MTEPNNWIAVACAEHARRGRDAATGGYMQVCHGKAAPLRRVQPGDRVAYYAPTLAMRGAAAATSGGSYQHFVSVGVVQPGQPYAFDMGGGFVPYRRDVRYVPAQEAPIAPLLDALEFVGGDRSHWGYKLRFGLFGVSDHDMRLIAQAMAADLGALRLTKSPPGRPKGICGPLGAEVCGSKPASAGLDRPTSRSLWLRPVQGARAYSAPPNTGQ
jgi:hypothetical protein